MGRKKAKNKRGKKDEKNVSPGAIFTFMAAEWELSRQILSHLNFSISMALVL